MPLPISPVRKAFLIVPPTGLYIREDRCQTPIRHMPTVALRPPIDLMYAAASFRQGGAECRLRDYPAEGLTESHLKADLREFQPDLVLMSITTPGFDEDMRIASVIKKACPNAVTAAKGAHFNTLDVEALRRYPDLDLALRGEFEPACRELAEGKSWDAIAGIAFRTAENTILRTPNRDFIEDLDSIPFPARDLINNDLYLRPDTGEPQTTLVTNRGCPFNCIYCLANQVAGRKNRTRSAANIIAEIEECVNKFGIRSFLFRSDLFTANRDWVLELCSEILSHGLKIAWSCNSRVDTLDEEVLRKMKQAGCWIIAFGIESGSQEMLDKIGKKTNLITARRALKMTRQAGILSSIYFLIGLPWDTPDTIRASERFARETGPDVMEIFYVYPFPGTPLYGEAVKLGLLKEGDIPKDAYDQPAMDGLHFTRAELRRVRLDMLRHFYLRPHIIARTLWRARSWKEFSNYLRYGLQQLKEFL